MAQRDPIKALEAFLPKGYEKYFARRKSGRYMGLSIKCSKCGSKAPIELHYSSRKWRWLSVHISGCKGGMVK